MANKRHKHHKRLDINISIRPAVNGGFVVESYSDDGDSGPHIYAEIEGVLEFLIATFNKGN